MCTFSPHPILLTAIWTMCDNAAGKQGLFRLYRAGYAIVSLII